MFYRFLAGMALLCAVAPLQADEGGPLFHTPFAKTLEAKVSSGPSQPLYAKKTTFCEGPLGLPGVSIPIDGQLVYEGAGNAFISSGAVSFWWRPDGKIPREETSVLSISGFQRFYFCRWLHVIVKSGRLAVVLYHGDSAEVFEDEGAVPGALESGRVRKVRYEVTAKRPLKQGEWVHVTISWDMGRGLALYLDGKPAGAVKLPWFYGGNINQISLGVSSTSYTKARTSNYPQSFADVRIEEDWLTEADAAKLARNEAPEGTDRDAGPMLEERARRLGLGRELPLPQVGGKGALWLKQIGMRDARDVMRKARAGVDGDLGRAWPMYQGYSNSGEMLRIALPEGTEVDVVQALGSGSMQVLAAEAEAPILGWKAAPTAVHAALLPEPRKTSELQVKRADGVLFEVGAFRSAQKPLPAAAEEGWKFYPLAKAEPSEAIRRDFAPADRLTLATEAGEGGGLVLPAKQAVHALGPIVKGATGVKAIALDLVLEDVPAGADLFLMVADPLNYERQALVANVRLELGKGENRRQVVLDLRDLVYPDGTRPQVTLYSNTPLALKEARLGTQWASVEEAKAEAFPDLLALLNDDFQERSEGRPWAHDPKKLKGLHALLSKIDFLLELEPDNKEVQSYWHWTHPTQPTPKVELPPVPEGVPPWAFYTQRAIEGFRHCAHWWIDNRQNEKGEFGAPDGVNDDTDLIQDWLAIDLMNGPDAKIRESVEKVAEISWHEKTTDGFSNQVTDTLHIYEWGINAQTLAFLLNYGDPVYYERLLRFASRYPTIMEEACEGKHLHFKSWYFGASRVVTEGVYGRDILRNALLLQPAMLLAWYNGDPKAAEIVARWSTAMREHITERASKTSRVPGLSIAIPSGKVVEEDFFSLSFADAVLAAWEFTGDAAHKTFLGDIIQYEMSRKPLERLHSARSAVGTYLRETGDARWDARWKEAASDPSLWTRSMHNNNYKDLDYFMLTWLRTGEDRWLDEGAKLALYHLTWSIPMLTEAEATTDRVWVPQRLANQMTLGGLSILRNEIYPKHAVSWENASGRFAPLVRKRASDLLELEVCNLEPKPLEVDARLWALEPGVYEVTTRATAQSDPEKVLEEATSELKVERYTRLPLKLPGGSNATVSLRLKTKAAQTLHDRADLALSHLDARYNPATKELACIVHNIGTRESGPFEVVATVGGKEVARRQLPSLKPPEAYRTHKATVSLPVENPALPVIVEVRAGEGVEEITLHNNRKSLTPQTLPEP